MQWIEVPLRKWTRTCGSFLISGFDASTALLFKGYFNDLAYSKKESEFPGHQHDSPHAHFGRCCWARTVRDTTPCAQGVLSDGVCAQAFRKLALEWVTRTRLSEQPWLRPPSTCPRPACLQWSPQLQKVVWHELEIVPM